MPTIRTTMAPTDGLHGCPAGSSTLPGFAIRMERLLHAAAHLTPVEVIALRYSEDSPTLPPRHRRRHHSLGPEMGSSLVADRERDRDSSLDDGRRACRCARAM